MARWQRERRQQTIIVVAFTVLLCTAVGLMVWAGANRYYDANLKAIASIDGHVLPSRVYVHERAYELVKFYEDNGVPVAFENDPQIQQQKSDYDGVAINSLAEQLLLETVARQDGYVIADAEVRARYVDAFGQFRTRHVLVKIDDTATDKDACDRGRAHEGDRHRETAQGRSEQHGALEHAREDVRRSGVEGQRWRDRLGEQGQPRG